MEKENKNKGNKKMDKKEKRLLWAFYSLQQARKAVLSNSPQNRFSFIDRAAFLVKGKKKLKQ